MRRDSLRTLLGLQLPIVQGGMLWLATAELAAAVSNAGALGTVSPYAAMAADGDPLRNLERQVTRLKELTSRPFAVNVLLELPLAGVLLDRAADLGVGTIVTAAGDPGLYTPMLKERGVVVLHVVTSVAQALRAERAGVDAVVVQGIEAGGRHAPGSLPLFLLLPHVVNTVRLPVVAAGGMAHGWEIAKVLALGADAAQLGTRFVATTECPAHPTYKGAIVEAGDGATVLVGTESPARCLDTAFTRRLRELERSGASPEELRAAKPFRGSREAQLTGDLEVGELYCGASVGLIRRILPAGEVVERLTEEMIEALQTLGAGSSYPWQNPRV